MSTKHFLYEHCDLVVLWSGMESVYLHYPSGTVFRITGQNLAKQDVVINAYRVSPDNQLQRNRKELKGSLMHPDDVVPIVVETVLAMQREMGIHVFNHRRTGQQDHVQIPQRAN